MKFELKCPTDCPLYPERGRAVFGVGPLDAELVFIGEAPGKMEAKKGEPFVGDAGQLLDHQLELVGINRDEVFIFNTVMCNPRDGTGKNRKPDKKEIDCCRGNFVRQWKQLKNPNLVVVLGGTALKALLGVDGILKNRGRLFWNDVLKVKMMPTYHPAYLLRKETDSTKRGEQYEFQLFREDLTKAKTLSKKKGRIDPMAGCDYRILKTMPEARAFLKKLKERPLDLEGGFSFDIETRGLKPKGPNGRNIMCAGFSLEKNTAVCLPLFHPQSPWADLERKEVLALLKEAMTTPVYKFMQNGKFDWGFVASELLLEIKGYTFCEEKVSMNDSLYNQYMISTGERAGLKSQAGMFLGKPDYDADLIQYRVQHKLKPEENDKVPLEILGVYCDADADVTRQRVFQQMAHKRFQDQKVVKTAGFMAEVGVYLSRMENVGFKVDVKLASQVEKEVTKKIEAVQDEVVKLCGHEVNLDSPEQLSNFLYVDLKLPVQGRTPTRSEKFPEGMPSTDKEALKMLLPEHPIIKSVSEAKEASTQKKMFLKPLPEITAADGRSHTTYGLANSRTGRTTAEDPNLQQIPRASSIKQIYVVDDPLTQDFLSSDYSQLELRILAHMAGSGQMQDLYREGVDLHDDVVKDLFGISQYTVQLAHDAKISHGALPYKECRAATKQLNFMSIYGGGNNRAAEILFEYLPVEQAKLAMPRFGLKWDSGKEDWDNYYALGHAVRQRWFKKFVEVLDYTEKQMAYARKHGYVESLFGLRLYLPNINSDNDEFRGKDERRAVNMPIQSTATYICLLGIRQIHRFGIDKMFKPLIQVHDQIGGLTQANRTLKVAGYLKSALENLPTEEFGFKLDVPLVVDFEYGKNWGNLTKIDFQKEH